MTRKRCSALVAVLLALPGAAFASTLTVYAAGPRGLDLELVSAFERQTGDKVQLWASSTGKVLARLQAEKSRPRADVVILADQSAGLALQDEGMVSRYRPKRLVRQLRPALDPPSDFLSMGGDTVGIVVNTRALPGGQKPKRWGDLLKAEYSHQLSMPNPLLSGTCADLVLAYLQRHPRHGWAYFKGLQDNGAIWPGPNAAALQLIKLGSRSVLLAGVGHTSLKAQKQGNSLELILPLGGSLLIPRPIIILKSSSHQAKDRAFVDFVLSPAAQRSVAKALMLPALKAVEPASMWPDVNRVHFWDVDWRNMAEARAKVLRRFNDEIIR